MTPTPPPSSTRRTLRRRRGFSFVEVLFAVFLTGCCATIVAGAYPVATMSRTKADAANRASALAQKEIEAVRGLGYANLTPTQMLANGLIDSATPIDVDTYSFTGVDASLTDSAATVLPNGTARIAVSQVDAELRRVVVTILWNDRGTTRSFVLSTLVANL